MNDVFKMAQQAYHALSIAESELSRLYKENAELKNSLKREWVGLTDSDKQEAFDETQEASGGFWEFADYLEAKLKEKNRE